MGRTNGKLVPFLRNGLERDLYKNLKYEPGGKIFYIELPRYNRGRSIDLHEKILKDWYQCSGNVVKYGSYSNAKAVFQAALKKSVYLVSEQEINKKLRFHFGDPNEIKEKRRRVQEKERKSLTKSLASYDSSSESSETLTSMLCKMENLSPIFDQLEIDDPPSVNSSSSGYISGEEVEESDSVLDQQNEDPKLVTGNLELSLDFADVMDFLTDGKEMNGYDLGLDNIQIDDLFKPVDKSCSLMNQVEEMSVTPVDVSQFVRKKTYWLCRKKLNLDSILLLICEKQAIIEGSEITEGTTVIPNEVWEPGITYDLKTSLELEEKLFLFLSRRF